MSRSRSLALCLVLALLAAPSFAYTLYLKDGSTISTKGPYTVRNGNAYFTFENGSQGFLKLDLIDVPKTEERNQDDIGGAAVIEDTEVVEQAAPPPPKQRTLSDMIRERKQRDAQSRAAAMEAAPTPSPTAQGSDLPEPPRTPGGFPDLTLLERRPMSDFDLSSELLKAFRSQSVDGVRVFQGTRPTHALLEVTANSEGTVLRAMAVAAKSLGQIREQTGDAIEVIELLITTPTGQRAGQFFITREMAEDLLSSKIEPTEFYVQNVQF